MNDYVKQKMKLEHDEFVAFVNAEMLRLDWCSSELSRQTKKGGVNGISQGHISRVFKTRTSSNLTQLTKYKILTALNDGERIIKPSRKAKVISLDKETYTDKLIDSLGETISMLKKTIDNLENDKEELRERIRFFEAQLEGRPFMQEDSESLKKNGTAAEDS